MSDGGAKFLKDRFNLHATPEADAAARRTHDQLRRERDELDVSNERAVLTAQSERLSKSAEAKIENYLDRLLRITEYGTEKDPDHGRRQLKRLLHNNYVIKKRFHRPTLTSRVRSQNSVDSVGSSSIPASKSKSIPTSRALRASTTTSPNNRSTNSPR